MYNIEFSKGSKKQLKRLDKNTQRRIIKSIGRLRKGPYDHPQTKKMKGYEGDFFRLRVGQFRVIYELMETKVLIIIVRIGSRGDIYKLK